jgi:hypothetical protein
MTKDEAKTVAVKLILAVYDTIKEMGPEGAPSGPIYAALMGMGIRLDDYNAIIEALIKAKMVERKGHVLYAISR